MATGLVALRAMGSSNGCIDGDLFLLLEDRDHTLAPVRARGDCVELLKVSSV